LFVSTKAVAVTLALASTIEGLTVTLTVGVKQASTFCPTEVEPV
jgi:hypothetical protein